MRLKIVYLQILTAHAMLKMFWTKDNLFSFLIRHKKVISKTFYEVSFQIIIINFILFKNELTQRLSSLVLNCTLPTFLLKNEEDKQLRSKCLYKIEKVCFLSS